MYFDDVRKVYRAFQKGKEPYEKHIHTYANQLDKRVLLYELLMKYNRLELFPEALTTRSSLAASSVAVWLEDQKEIEETPGELKFVTTQSLTNGSIVDVFQFQMYEPHLLAPKGWMYAYAGFVADKQPENYKPDFVYSDFSDDLLSISLLEELSHS